MPRHSPCALVRLNFLIFFCSSCFSLELLEFHKQIILISVFFFSEKVLSFSWNCFIPPFGEIVVITQIGKTLIDLTNLVKSLIVLLSVRFLLLHLYSVFNEHNIKRFRVFTKFYSMSSPLLCFRKVIKLASSTSVDWWAQVDSNHRPRAYQARALTTWAMSPYVSFRCISFIFTHHWWRWRESNPWPPACRAGALPAELHPHKMRNSEEAWSMISLPPTLFSPFLLSYLSVTQNWTTMKDCSSHCCACTFSRRLFWFWSISKLTI